MTDPLTPPDCDLRDFAFMPIDASRLLGSEFHATSSDAAWRAGVTLWLRSWHQVPAASLPNDDIQLARLAEFGRDLKNWKKIRADALRGWITADDGRLYHSVVAEKALEAWLEKLAQRISSGAGNAKRWKIPFDSGGIEQQIATATTMLELLSPHSRALTKTRRRQSQRDDHGNAGGIPSGMPSGSQGTGTGTGTGTGNLLPLPDGKGGDDPEAEFWRCAKSYLKPHLKGDPGAMIAKWLRERGKDVTVAAINAAQIERAVDPVAYIGGYFRRHAKPQEGGLSVPC